MAFIEVIPENQADGELKEIYEQLISSRGKLAEVHKIQSLNPKTIVAHMELYMSIMFAKSPLRRWQREMIAVIVSKHNNCPYCIAHHAEALNHFWKDQAKIEQLLSDYSKIGLPEADLALCEQAARLTTKPGEMNELGVKKLKKVGFSDRAILDCSLVISYFNFVNRMVLSLGVELEKEGAGGYEYN